MLIPTQNDTFNLDSLSYASRYNAAIISDFISALKIHTKAPLADLIDFGAGIGTLTQDLVPLAKSVIAVEPEKAYRDLLATRCTRTVVSLSKIHSPVDAIFSSNVLEHIPNDGEMLDLFFQKLNPGGLLFLYVPAIPFLYSEMDRAVGHVRRYRKIELQQKLVQAGFIPRTLEYRDAIGVAASLWLKVQGNRSAHPSRSLIQFYDKWLFPASQQLDKLGFSRIVGKNLLAVATKPNLP